MQMKEPGILCFKLKTILEDYIEKGKQGERTRLIEDFPWNTVTLHLLLCFPVSCHVTKSIALGRWIGQSVLSQGL